MLLRRPFRASRALSSESTLAAHHGPDSAPDGRTRYMYCFDLGALRRNRTPIKGEPVIVPRQDERKAKCSH